MHYAVAPHPSCANWNNWRLSSMPRPMLCVLRSTVSPSLRCVVRRGRSMGEAFYIDGFRYAVGSTSAPVLVCIKREGYYILTVESGHNILENGNNTLYLQGQAFPGGNISYTSDAIVVGCDVDSTQTQGNVVVKQGSLIFDSSVKTVIQNGFKCEKGARLTIK